MVVRAADRGGDRNTAVVSTRACNDWNCGPGRIGLQRHVVATPERLERLGPAAPSAYGVRSHDAPGTGSSCRNLDIVVDSCSVRAKRGELTGPNPTNRAKLGTKYHGIVASDSLPLTAFSTGTVNHTMRFPACCAALWRSALPLCGSMPMPDITAPRT